MLTWLKRGRNTGATVGFEQAFEDPIERSPDPEERLLISCDQQQVRQALEQLPLEFREAVVLREMEGLLYTRRSPQPSGSPSETAACSAPVTWPRLVKAPLCQLRHPSGPKEPA